MVDKVSALPRMRLRDRIGQVQDVEMREVETALSTFLGMAR
jgi:mRNA-degrading endonuclease toxin of MazEF toxin-antitoxin module